MNEFVLILASCHAICRRLDGEKILPNYSFSLPNYEVFNVRTPTNCIGDRQKIGLKMTIIQVLHVYILFPPRHYLIRTTVSMRYSSLPDFGLRILSCSSVVVRSIAFRNVLQNPSSTHPHAYLVCF